MRPLEKILTLKESKVSEDVIEGRTMRPVEVSIRTKAAEVVIHKQQIAPGVYLGTLLSKVRSAKSIVLILNSSKVEQSIRPEFSNFNQYKGPKGSWIGNIRSIGVCSRVKSILKTL